MISRELLKLASKRKCLQILCMHMQICVFVCSGSRPRGYSVSSLSLASLNLADNESVQSDKRTSRWDHVQFTITFPVKDHSKAEKTMKELSWLQMARSCVNQHWHWHLYCCETSHVHNLLSSPCLWYLCLFSVLVAQRQQTVSWQSVFLSELP